MLMIHLPKFTTKETSGDYSVYSYSRISSIERTLNLAFTRIIFFPGHSFLYSLKSAHNGKEIHVCEINTTKWICFKIRGKVQNDYQILPCSNLGVTGVRGCHDLLLGMFILSWFFLPNGVSPIPLHKQNKSPRKCI